MRIAIDGPAGAGKSTVARAVADILGFTHLDSGALYRAVALAALRDRLDPGDGKGLRQLADRLPLALDGRRVLLSGQDVTDAIRTPEVDRIVSTVASHPEVREAMVALQRRLGAKGDVVAEGRDIGTVVWPDAELKIFLTASLRERAERRLAERGGGSGVQGMMKEIAARDENDRRRAVGPLRQAPDAIVLDTTGLSIDRVVRTIASLAEERRL